MATSAMHVRCPSCGRVNDAVTGVNGAVFPKPGSVSICIGCGGWAVYELDFIGLRLREPTEAERESMEKDPTVQRVTAAWRETIAWERARRREDDSCGRG